MIMSAGLEILNDNGHIQITEKFRNLQFLGKGTTTIRNNRPGYYWGETVIDFDDNETKFIAFRSSSWVESYTSTKNNRIYCSFTGEPGTVITYYRFGYPVPIRGNYLEVYDSLDRLVFSDNSKYMKVIDFFTGTWDQKEGYVNKHKKGITPAILVGQSVYHVVVGRGFVGVWTQAFEFKDDCIKTYLAVDAGEASPGEEYSFGNFDFSYLILDVTGL